MAEHAEATLTTTVKKTGGSLMVTVPAAVRDALHLVEGQELRVTVEGDRLVYEPARRRRLPKYTLAELLAQCNPDLPLSEAEKEERNAWLNGPPAGRETW
jgi:antitoxin ChpS